MKTLTLLIVLLFATPAAAATLDIAAGETAYWPSSIPATVYGQSFTVPDTATLTIDAAYDIHVGAFTYDSPLLEVIPIGTYVCPAGQVCALSRFGLSVIVQGSVGITPGTGGLGVIGGPSHPIAAADGDEFIALAALLVAAGLLLRRWRHIVLVGLLLFLNGCSVYYWQRPGAGAADFDGENRRCVAEAVIAYDVVNEDIYRECMKAKTWRRVLGYQSCQVQGMTAPQCPDPDVLRFRGPEDKDDFRKILRESADVRR